MSLERTTGVLWILLPTSQHQQRRFCALPFAVKPHLPSHYLATAIPPLSHYPLSSGRLLWPLAPSTKQEPLHTLGVAIQLLCPGTARPAVGDWHPFARTAAHTALVDSYPDSGRRCPSHRCKSPPHGNPQRLRTSSPTLISPFTCLFLLRLQVLKGMFLKRHQMFDDWTDHGNKQLLRGAIHSMNVSFLLFLPRVRNAF